MKRIVLIVLSACAFLVGYASAAEAWPVFSRNEHYGYFLNRHDDAGMPVVPEGIHSTNVNDFINTINSWRGGGSNIQHRRAAAFITLTMNGDNEHNYPATTAQIAKWERIVRYAASQDRIVWNGWATYSLNSYYQYDKPGDPMDDAFYINGEHTDRAIMFLDEDDNVAYKIKRSCANPIGAMSDLPEPPTYTISGWTTVTDDTVTPGQTVTFRNYLRNAGPDSAFIDWETRDAANDRRIDSEANEFVRGGTEKSVSTVTYTVPLSARAGDTHCRYIYFAPRVNDTGSGRGGNVCVTVIADFALQPQVSASSSNAQSGDSVTFTYRIQNDGPTDSTNVTCKVAGLTHSPGYSPLPQQDSDRNPAVDPQPALSCNRPMNVGRTTVGSEVVDVGNIAPGSRICRSLVINPRDQNGGYRSSAESCVVISKAPYVHFMGNDVWAGGGFEAVNPACNSSSKIDGVTHTLGDGSIAGSGVEYAAYALGRITHFGSANRALSPSNAFGRSMTLSNFDVSNLGYFGAPHHCVTDYINRYSSTPITAQPGTMNVGTRTSGTWHVNGNRTFHGDMPVSSQQIYLVEGDVTISNNLTYPGSYGGVNEIPSLVIIATGNITIQEGVTEISGLFISRGTFATCNPPAGSLSVSICNQQLTVNGAVIANRLNLLRTHGADGANDTVRKRPAEVFRFNSEMYLRNALNGNSSMSLETVDQRDLPPRF